MSEQLSHENHRELGSQVQGADVASEAVRDREPVNPAIDINNQIDQYMVDSAVRTGPQGIDNGFHSYQRVKGGDIIRDARHGNPKKGVTRVIDVKGDVDGKQLRSKIETFGFEPGSELGHVVSVSTSDGRSSHSLSPFGGPNGYAGVSRKTEEGKDNYVHRFKDPKKAGELIASLASKRTSNIVVSKKPARTEKPAA